ncbi:MAG: outer membrane protein assembly factor BamB, partial [Pseudomonadota bacterium]
VIALNARDGEELWRINVAGEVLAAPVITRGMAIIRTVNGRIKALNLSTGVERWESEFELPRLTLRGNSPPVVSGDLIISGMDNGRVVALDSNDGSRVWESILTLPSGRTDLELLADVDAAIRVIGERLFVVGYQGRIGMLSRDSGQVLWSHDLSSYAGMGADWTRLYITDSDSEVVALDQNTGSTLWRQNAMRARWLTAPTSIGRNIVVGDFEGYLHWLNGDTGDLVARTRVGKEALINPAKVAGETLLVLSSDSKLAAYQVIPPKVE